ncbi:XRE family transcriptional regulator [Streptacidiphilus sp. P02-A3a]|uniref:XRE family transcriptional regulator n=1 Tax=Streptacidiphilus sp. P02-A3a TaxID=2704468 RepID=UPI0015F97F6E|nr:XRE family transcriptional regulator [Streptacidiphilus sp. P02-A3a]QMU73310.1 XRE family transcriptional regulator [Streptacidiphilus sp. P02-A3a]
MSDLKAPGANWRLVAARVERGWLTQEDFVSAYEASAVSLRSQARISVRQVRRWESGQSKWPNRDARLVLKEMFGVPLEQLGFVPLGSAAGRRGVPADVKPFLEDTVLRRAFMGGALAAVAAPLLDLAALDHLTAASRDAHRYADHELVGHLGDALEATARADTLAGPHRAMPAALGILSAIDSTARDAKPHVRRELLGLGSRAAEFAGWLHRDAGSPEQAIGYWHGLAKEWATFTGDGAMHAYVLMRQAQALGRSDPVRMLDLARAATSGPWTLPPRPRAEALQQEARGMAMTGADTDEIRRVLDLAHAALDQASGPAAPVACTGPLGDSYTRERLMAQTGICLREAGRPAEAAAVFKSYVTREAFMPRDYAHYRAFLAGALAEAGEPDEAAVVALGVVEIASAARSGQALGELNRSARALFPYRERPAVGELHERLLLPSTR